MTYATQIKTGRMTVVRDALNSGSLQLLNAGGAVMGSTGLDPSSGSVSGDLLTLAGMPKQITATVASSWGAPVSSARFRSSASADVKTGLTVGLSQTAAPPWAGSQAYTANQTRTNGVGQYRVVTPGTSAASGGPTGTGQAIVDGTVTWAYIAPANASIQLSAMEWNVGDVINVQSATLQHAP
jgi:hypothetical protein